jgi:hypothetical protein
MSRKFKSKRKITAKLATLSLCSIQKVRVQLCTEKDRDFEAYSINKNRKSAEIEI